MKLPTLVGRLPIALSHMLRSKKSPNIQLPAPTGAFLCLLLAVGQGVVSAVC